MVQKWKCTFVASTPPHLESPQEEIKHRSPCIHAFHFLETPSLKSLSYLGNPPEAKLHHFTAKETLEDCTGIPTGYTETIYRIG